MTTLETPHLEITTLGAGCFWCIEAIYQDVKGVHSVVSGYMGGHTKNPNYEQICNGDTGHAEVTQIQFDPSVISFEDMLYIFWQTHDPTTLNRQGNDTGTQYRSAVFYHDDRQKQIAATSKTEAAKLFSDPIVTEITPAAEFYKAEPYHQNFYKLNPNQPYCRYVVDPKVKKFRKSFADKVQVA